MRERVIRELLSVYTHVLAPPAHVIHVATASNQLYPYL